ncbi:hypothetical protein [Halomonas ventosae]|uniref:Uncharacterized protein n=1 Tax=Halomonas ventosae TaxID=229007 RepID=A0A2T0VPP0_9GAMM|nr:hypothetical protein [Halomonas ventosae]PRY72280.1 hypothetical protein BCL64_10499 [Halomonas ventosae]
MTISAIPVDQRVIGIDSRRFASIEKALVELVTNCDDSYGRLERAGEPVSGEIRIEYERHQSGALLKVTDQAEGLSFERAASILTYGGAHSPLARGEGEGAVSSAAASSRRSTGSAMAGSRRCMTGDTAASSCSVPTTAATSTRTGTVTGLPARGTTVDSGSRATAPG